MKSVVKLYLVCGIALMLAAFPAFAQQDVLINKKPLRDFSEYVFQRVNEKKIDLTKPFSVELKGILTKEGKLDPKTARFTKSEGDKGMIAVGKSFIEAINDSGFFAYLSKLGAEKINIALSQDENRLTGIITSEVETTQRARTTSSGLKSFLQVAQLQTKNEDDKLLLSYFFVTSNDKNLVVNFAAPREEFQRLVEKNLEKMTTKASIK